MSLYGSRRALLSSGKIPAWVLRTGGKLAGLDIDFVNNRGWNSGLAAIPSLLTCSRASIGYYTTADGLLKQFAANKLRYGNAGLLVEESRTNLLLQSNTFGTTWAAGNLTNLTTTTPGPDGNATSGTLLNENTTNSDHAVTQTLTKAASALPYTFTVYAKAGVNRTRLALRLDNGSGNGTQTVFDLVGGVAIAPTPVGGGFTSTSAAITPLANGWYACSLSATSDATTSLLCWVMDDAGSGSAAINNFYAGTVGDGVFIFGAQLEQAAFATSYIPTTTASQTRPFDNVTMLVSAISGYSAAAGTLYAQASCPPRGRPTTSYISFNDNSGSQFTALSYLISSNDGEPSSSINTTAGGSVYSQTDFHARTPGAAIRSALSWSVAGGGDFAADGLSIGNGAIAALASPPLTTLQLNGIVQSGFGCMNTYIQRVAFFTTKLSGSTLAALTSWSQSELFGLASLDINFVANSALTRALNSASPIAIASLLTCTRSSSGYYQNANGTLASIGTNLQTHSSNENSSWSLTAVSLGSVGIAPDGTTTAQLYIPSAPNTNHLVIAPSVTVSNATNYTYSFYAKFSGNPALATWNADCFGGVVTFNTQTGATSWSSQPAGSAVSSIALPNGWYRFIVTWTTTGTSVGFDGYIGAYGSVAGDGTNGIYVWGAQLEQWNVASLYQPTTTSTQVALRNGSNGLLVEEARTNVSLWSQVLSNAVYNLSHVTETDNVIAAPDGTLTGCQLVSAAGQDNNFNQTSSSVGGAGKTWTLSFYAKVASSTFALPVIGDDGNANYWIGTGPGTSGAVANLTTSWQRFTFTGTQPGGSVGANLRWGFGGFSSWTTANTIYVWGIQMEQASFATSYIPTLGASASRTVEFVTLTNPALVANAAATFYAQTNTQQVGPGAPRMVGVTSGGATTLFVQDATHVGIFNATTALTTTLGSGTFAGGIVKSASAYDGSGRSICGNAGTVASDSNVQLTPTLVSFGSDNNGNSDNLDGYISRITQWNMRLSSVPLQVLTT